MELHVEKGNWVQLLDPRVKLLIVILMSVLTFITESTELFMYYYLLILLLFFTSKLYKSGMGLLIFITISFALLLFGHGIQSKGVRESYLTIIGLIQRLSVFVAMGIWASSNMKVGTFVTSLEQMRVPKGLTITTAVVFRYIPTVKQEFYYIKNTMKLRGIYNAKHFIQHPIKTFEYSLVPMVIRCMTIADELSASAMTRGLDLETQRISIVEVKIKMSDVMVTVLLLVLLVGGMVLYKMSGRGL